MEQQYNSIQFDTCFPVLLRVTSVHRSSTPLVRNNFQYRKFVSGSSDRTRPPDVNLNAFVSILSTKLIFLVGPHPFVVRAKQTIKQIGTGTDNLLQTVPEEILSLFGSFIIFIGQCHEPKFFTLTFCPFFCNKKTNPPA